MTTAQLQIWHIHRLLGALLLCALSLMASCTGAKLPPPEPLASPYPQETQVIIAVAPLLNESGTTVVDELEVADAIANTIQSIEGLSAIPVNRTIAAMRSRGLARVLEPVESVQLARALGADAIVVGTITAWHPYEPPQIGMSLALFAASDALRGMTHATSTRGRSPPPRAITGCPSRGATRRPSPCSPSSSTRRTRRSFDASSDTRAFGRTAPRPRIPQYTASMKLYAKFVTHELVSDLLDLEVRAAHQFRVTRRQHGKSLTGRAFTRSPPSGVRKAGPG